MAYGAVIQLQLIWSENIMWKEEKYQTAMKHLPKSVEKCSNSNCSIKRAFGSVMEHTEWTIIVAHPLKPIG